jgi:hypothetical protein
MICTGISTRPRLQAWLRFEVSFAPRKARPRDFLTHPPSHIADHYAQHDLIPLHSSLNHRTHTTLRLSPHNGGVLSRQPTKREPSPARNAREQVGSQCSPHPTETYAVNTAPIILSTNEMLHNTLASHLTLVMYNTSLCI